MWRETAWKSVWKSLAGGAVVVMAMSASAAAAAEDVTYTKNIAPVLQRSCENCHRADGVAPMSLSTYEEVRPWARAIKQRTSIGPHAGVMPPWYVEKNIGIQEYQNDPSLSDEEIAMIGKWADTGAPRGNPADMPAKKVYPDGKSWTIGTPDLIVKLPEVTVKGDAPDWWGEIPSTPTGLTEDRYVAALEIKEFNDIDNKGGTGRQTVGGHFVFHHMIWSTSVDPRGSGRSCCRRREMPWRGPSTKSAATPISSIRVQRSCSRPDRRSSRIPSISTRTAATRRRTSRSASSSCRRITSRSIRQALVALGNGVDIDIKGMTADQQLHAYAVLQENTKIVSFEPHLHAPGQRMCLEAIWGYNIQTLSCVGYDHNWVRGYTYRTITRRCCRKARSCTSSAS